MAEEDDSEELQRRIRELEERVARLEEALTDRLGTDPTPEPSPEREAPAGWAQTDPEPQPAAEASPEAVRFEPETAPEPEEARDLEDLLGADVLAKAGMLVLVLGVAFFLRYAFENDWISLTGRIVLGVVGGLALVAVGDLLHRRDRYGAYPQVLAGGGTAITYFSLYAAHAFEAYRAATGMTLELDAVLLGLTALGLVGYATWREMPTLAGLAVVLGAVTALVAERFDTFAVLYLVVLTATVVGAAAYRRWTPVAVTALVASHLTLALDLSLGVEPVAVMWGAGLLLGLFVVAAWRSDPESGRPIGPTLAGAVALLAVWGLVHGSMGAFAVVYPVVAAAGLVAVSVACKTPAPALAGLPASAVPLAIALSVGAAVTTVLWTSLLLLVVFTAAAWLVDEPLPTSDLQAGAVLAGASVLATWGLLLWALSLEEMTAWDGPVTGGLALLSVGLATLPAASRQARIGWGVAAAVTALAWAPIQFDGGLTVLAWSGLVLVGAVVRTQVDARALRGGLLAGGGLIVGHLLVEEAERLHEQTMNDLLGLGVFAFATLALVAAWRAEAHREHEQASSVRWLLAGSVLTPLLFVGSAMDGSWIPVTWAVIGLVLVGLGFLADLRDVRMASLAVFALVLGRVFLVDLSNLEVVYRIVTFLVVGAILLGASFLYARASARDPD